MILSYLVIVGGTSITNGLYSPVVFCLIILPVAAFITSRKQGKYWLIISLLTVVILYILEQFKFPFANIISKEYYLHFQLTITLMVLFISSVLSLLLNRSSFYVYQAKELVEEKNKIIEKQSQHITSSINYAKLIQNSILPSEKAISSNFPEFFIFFKPKDIVSGDFYWYSEVSRNGIPIYIIGAVRLYRSWSARSFHVYDWQHVAK